MIQIFVNSQQQRKYMKTVQQLQEEVYQQALDSGCFRNLQSQLKTYVFELIEKEYNNGKSKKGFEYEHPLLPKLKKYPLTCLCMDLIQEFLQSFKFKHTLNVFKKQINRNFTINRSSLAEQFKIQIKNPQSQAILLSLVSQMFTGEVGAIKNNNNNIKINNFVESKPDNQRNNNFINQSTSSNKKEPIKTQPNFKKSNNTSVLEQSKSQSKSMNENSNSSKSNIPSSSNNQSSSNIKKEQTSQNSSKQQNSKENSSSPSVSEVKVQKQEEKKKKGGKQEKKKVEKQAPPQAATDLLGDVMKKFGGVIKGADKQQEKKQLFESKRAFSEQKEKKVLDPSQSGANKIRGASIGANIGSFMNKFMPQKQPVVENKSFIDEQLDEFQQSKDSTRRNPLFSSSQSGFDKSGFDHSVDSNAIEEYQYYERAKKPIRKI